MATLSWSLNVLEGHFCYLKPFYLPYLGSVVCFKYNIFMHASESTRGWLVISTVFYKIEDARSQAVTYHSKCCISETVQDGVITAAQ